MRVLWLRPTKGRVSVRRERIAEHLRDRGFDIQLVDVSPRTLPSVLNAVFRGEYDVLVGNVRAGLYVGYPAARLSGHPFVADISDPITDIEGLPAPVFWVLKRYERWILGRIRDAIYVPEAYREVEGKGFAGQLAPNSVDFEKFADPDPDVVDRCRDVLQGEGVDVDEPLAIYVGAFTDDRNIDTILDAAARCPDWQFVFVGEGALEPAVERTAERTDNVFFPGAFEHDMMPGFMVHASAAFCLIDVERPIKIAEYGAAGLPVLGKPGKLQREFSDDEILFVDPTPEGIVDGLTRLSASPDFRERLTTNLRNDAREHSWSAVANIYEDVIRSKVDP